MVNFTAGAPRRPSHLDPLLWGRVFTYDTPMAAAAVVVLTLFSDLVGVGPWVGLIVTAVAPRNRLVDGAY